MLFPTPARIPIPPAPRAPSIKCALAFVALFLVQMRFTGASRNNQDSDLTVFRAGNSTSYSNGTLAPYVHNVTGTYTWILPRGKYDIGAGSMMCECFDPADGCCMPTSHNVAPFCVAGNTTCCGDTYCSAGETCCGGACCPSSTTCTITDSIPGCCPTNTTCTGLPSCLNATSSVCSNANPLPANCCPQSLPVCGLFADGGQACFASMPPTSTVSSTQLRTTTVTVQDTLEVLSEPSASTEYTFWVPPQDVNPSVATFSNEVAVYTTVWAINNVASSFPAITEIHLPTTTITVEATLTVPCGQSPPPGYSLWRPDASAPVSTFPTVVAVYTTLWAIELDTSASTNASAPSLSSYSSTTASTSGTGGGVCDPSPCEPEPTSGTLASTTSQSVLCFNSVLLRDMPCPSASVSASVPFDYSPAGVAKVVPTNGAGGLQGRRSGGVFSMVVLGVVVMADIGEMVVLRTLGGNLGGGFRAVRAA